MSRKIMFAAIGLAGMLAIQAPGGALAGSQGYYDGDRYSGSQNGYIQATGSYRQGGDPDQYVGGGRGGGSGYQVGPDIDTGYVNTSGRRNRHGGGQNYGNGYGGGQNYGYQPPRRRHHGNGHGGGQHYNNGYGGQNYGYHPPRRRHYSHPGRRLLRQLLFGYGHGRGHGGRGGRHGGWY